MTGAALMKFGRAPTTHRTFIGHQSLPCAALRRLSPQGAVPSCKPNGPYQGSVVQQAEGKGGGGPLLPHSQSRQTPPCEREPIAHRLRDEQIGEPSFHQRHIAEQQRDEGEGSHKPAQLVGDVLKEQSVSPRRDEIGTEADSLIIAGKRSDLTSEFAPIALR